MKCPKTGFISSAIVFLFLISSVHAETSASVEGDYIKVSCDCTCKDKTIQTQTIYKTGTNTEAGIGTFMSKINPVSLSSITIDIAQPFLYYEIAYAKLKCGEQCAKTCAGYTSCDSSCGQCCTDYSTKNYKYTGKSMDMSFGTGLLKVDPEKYMIEANANSCRSTCTYRSNVRQIVETIQYIAGLLGAIMLVVNGIRFMTSENPDERREAKKGLIYTIIALIIIMLAASMVGIFMNTALTPAT